MENSILFNGLVLKILIFISSIIAFLLTERRFAFDLRQKIKLFVSYFIISYLGLLIVMVILSGLAGYFREQR